MSANPSLVVPLTGGRSLVLLPQQRTDNPDGTWQPTAKTNLDLVDFYFGGQNGRFDCGPGGSGKRKSLQNTGLLDITDAEFSHVLTVHAQWKNTLNQTQTQNAAYVQGLHTRQLNQPVKDAIEWDFEPAEIIRLLKMTRDGEGRDGWRLAPDTLVSWSKTESARLVCLDLDFHASNVVKPLPNILEDLARKLSPTPMAWWLTQGGGFHAIYVAGRYCNAEELAAGALAQLYVHPLVVYHQGTVEIKTGTRHPLAEQKGKWCGPIHETIPDENFACLARLTPAGVNDAERDAFLAKKEWVIGSSLEHSECPIDPLHESSTKTPVFVAEKGLYCHSCASRLKTGMRSWLSVMTAHKAIGSGEERLTALALAAQNLVVWAHVDYLFATLMPQIPSVIRKHLYRALIKMSLKDSNDPRIPMVFNDEWSFVRGDGGRWLHADDLRAAKALARPDMLALPSTLDLSVSDKGVALKPRVAAVAAHLNDGMVPGFRPIMANLFVPIYWQHNSTLADEADKEGKVMVYSPLRCKPKLSAPNRDLTYLKSTDRDPLDQARKLISARWPGINHTYLDAILLALGHGESGEGRLPMLWAQGESGSGKTTTLKLVAAIFGEETINLSGNKEDRFDILYNDALDNTRFVLLDDFAKEESTHAMFSTFILRAGRYFSSHKYHVGLRSRRVHSPIFLTDWSMPAVFVNDRQFGRRVHMIQLHDVVEKWDDKSAIDGWWKETPELRKAVESWYSHLVDEYFSVDRVVTWLDAMKRLNVPLVADMDHDESSLLGVRRTVIRLAYELIKSNAESPPLGQDLAGILPNGSVHVQPGATQPVGLLVERLIATLGTPKFHWLNLRRVLTDHAKYIQDALGLKCPARINGVMHGPSLYLRVVEQSPGRHSKRHGKQLCHTWPLPESTINPILNPKPIEELDNATDASKVKSDMDGHDHTAVNDHNGHATKTNGHNGHAATNGFVLPGFMQNLLSGGARK